MNRKKQLEQIFLKQNPAAPPHFELLFFLEKEFIGIDRNAINQGDYSYDFLVDKDIEIKTYLVEELGWAAVYGSSLFTGLDSINHIRTVKEKLGKKAFVFAFNGDGVFWMPSGADIMDFVVMLFERPDQMHQKAKEKLEKAKELAVKQRDAGADFIIQNSDFGFNSGPFISPTHFKEFVTPYMTEFVRFVHDLGLPIILHSDGNINDILDQIYSTGIDGYQSVDPQGHMDIKQVRKDYPDWILMGNVPCNLLQDDDESKIRQAVRECMELGGVGKPYIFSTSNCIFEGMPAENYKIMLDEYERVCRL